jgi:lipopolysaccharide/colanic/teichoic acid biosynthesis glycosyltransferase
LQAEILFFGGTNPCHSLEETVSTKSFVEADFEDSDSELSTERSISGDEDVSEKQIPPRNLRFNSHSTISLVREKTSSWSQSGTKRLFDFLSVLLALPLLVPIYLVIALAVRLTSSGPVLFLQKRVGRHGQAFTILKFRTMMHSEDAAHHAVTTTENQPFTPVGPFLRRYKLDELPQLLNVLVGDMSLVGARPKLPEHQIADLLYRPGITGAATYAFAREEKVLARVPKHYLDTYYHTVILPTKSRLDEEYMAHATFRTDIKLIFNSVLRRWDDFVVDNLPEPYDFDSHIGMRSANPVSPKVRLLRTPSMTSEPSLPSAEEASSL